jgi:arylsulfatase A
VTHLFNPAALRRGLALAVSALPVMAASAATTTAEKARPNVIFIMADDLGYGEVGCYGQERIKTPALDKMAAEGAKHTQFYTGAPVCAPARYTLLTGIHSGHAFVRGNGAPPMPEKPVTLGKLFQDAGYATGCFGKWGMGQYGTPGAPDAHGFGEFVGFISQTAAHNHYPKTLYRNDQVWELPEGTYAHDVFTSEALDFVKRNASRPFFMYLPYTIPHQKLVVPSQGEYANETWPENEKNKAAMISRMDADVGRLLQQLAELGIDEKTLVMFTSDNGPHKEGSDPNFFKSSGPFRGIKRSLHEGGIRVPMIVRWPGTIQPVAENPQIWGNWDVLPTLLDVAGIKDPEKRDGISIKTSLLENKPVERGPLYWEFYEHGFAQAVRNGDWKLLRTTTGALELYNLPQDPGERNSLSAQRADLVTEMLPLLTSMRTNSEHWHMRHALENKGKVPQPGKKGKARNQNRQNRRAGAGAQAR